MATTVSTGSTNFDQMLVALVDKRLEELLRAPLPWLLPGNFRPAKFVKGTNNTMRFLNIPDLPVVTGTPVAGTAPWLTEGVAPTTQDFEFGYEEFSANQAGIVVRLTDKALLESPIDLIAEGADRVAYNAIRTADQRMGDICLAGTNVLYAGVGNTATDDIQPGDVVTGAIYKRAAALLKGTKVPQFGEGGYRAIQHPFVSLDLESDPDAGGWIDANRYVTPDKMLNGELGKYAGIRFIETANAGVKATRGASSEDVYATFIFGPEAYAFGDWGTIESHITPPGGGSDPLFQRALVGWKGFFGGVLIGEGANATNVSPPRYIIVESAASI